MEKMKANCHKDSSAIASLSKFVTLIMNHISSTVYLL